MKAIVTGAAGFIGFHVCQALLRRGDRVLGVDDLNPYYDPTLKQARLDQLAAQKAFRTVGQLDPEAKTGTAQVKAIRTREKAWAQVAKKRAGQPPRTVAASGTYRTYKATGEAAEQEGDFAFAQANFERAETAASGKSSRSAAANFQGLLALRNRNPKAALEHLQRATQSNAANKYAWNNLGSTLMKLFDAGAGGTELIEQAIEAFKKMRRIDKTYRPENLAWAKTVLAKVTGKPKPKP